MRFKFCLKYKGSCLKQKSATNTFRNRITCFIVYELDSCLRDLNSDFTLGVCLFGAVKLATNADPEKYVCSGYDIGFATRTEYSLPDGSLGKNVIVFGS